MSYCQNIHSGLTDFCLDLKFKMYICSYAQYASFFHFVFFQMDQSSQKMS